MHQHRSKIYIMDLPSEGLRTGHHRVTSSVRRLETLAASLQKLVNGSSRGLQTSSVASPFIASAALLGNRPRPRQPLGNRSRVSADPEPIHFLPSKRNKLRDRAPPKPPSPGEMRKGTSRHADLAPRVSFLSLPNPRTGLVCSVRGTRLRPIRPLR